MDKSHEAFVKFMDLVRSVTDCDHDTTKRIQRCYNKAEQDFLASSDFRSLVKTTADKLKQNPVKKYVHILEFVKVVKTYEMKKSERGTKRGTDHEASPASADSDLNLPDGVSNKRRRLDKNGSLLVDAVVDGTSQDSTSSKTTAVILLDKDTENETQENSKENIVKDSEPKIAKESSLDIIDVDHKDRHRPCTPQPSTSKHAFSSKVKQRRSSSSSSRRSCSPRSPGRSPVRSEKSHESKKQKKIKGGEKQIARLEKFLEDLHKRITQLEEEEISLDELKEEYSTYTQIARYKERFLKVWNKLCELRGALASTGRVTERKFRFEGTRYPEVNKKIERYINKFKCFPDYTDIYDLVSACNRKHHLKLGKRLLEQIARDAFTDVGNKLQERRHRDYIDNFGSHLTENFRSRKDPALFDRELERKLQANRKVGQDRLDEVISKYSEKQERHDFSETSEDEDEDAVIVTMPTDCKNPDVDVESDAANSPDAAAAETRMGVTHIPTIAVSDDDDDDDDEHRKSDNFCRSREDAVAVSPPSRDHLNAVLSSEKLTQSGNLTYAEPINKRSLANSPNLFSDNQSVTCKKHAESAEISAHDAESDSELQLVTIGDISVISTSDADEAVTKSADLGTNPSSPAPSPVEVSPDDKANHAVSEHNSASLVIDETSDDVAVVAVKSPVHDFQPGTGTEETAETKAIGLSEKTAEVERVLQTKETMDIDGITLIEKTTKENGESFEGEEYGNLEESTAAENSVICISDSMCSQDDPKPDLINSQSIKAGTYNVDISLDMTCESCPETQEMTQVRTEESDNGTDQDKKNIDECVLSNNDITDETPTWSEVKNSDKMEMKQDLSQLKEDMLEGKETMSEVKPNMSEVKQDMSEVTEDVSEGKQDMSEGKQDMSEGKQDISEITQDKSDGKLDMSEVTQDMSVVTQDMSEIIQVTSEGKTDLPKENLDKVVSEINTLAKKLNGSDGKLSETDKTQDENDDNITKETVSSLDSETPQDEVNNSETVVCDLPPVDEMPGEQKTDSKATEEEDATTSADNAVSSVADETVEQKSADQAESDAEPQNAHQNITLKDIPGASVDIIKIVNDALAKATQNMAKATQNMSRTNPMSVPSIPSLNTADSANFVQGKEVKEKRLRFDLKETKSSKYKCERNESSRKVAHKKKATSNTDTGDSSSESDIEITSVVRVHKKPTVTVRSRGERITKTTPMRGKHQTSESSSSRRVTCSRVSPTVTRRDSRDVSQSGRSKQTSTVTRAPVPFGSSMQASTSTYNNPSTLTRAPRGRSTVTRANMAPVQTVMPVGGNFSCNARTVNLSANQRRKTPQYPLQTSSPKPSLKIHSYRSLSRNIVINERSPVRNFEPSRSSVINDPVEIIDLSD